MTSLLEREFSLEDGGLAWPVKGPLGRDWLVMWRPAMFPVDNVRAWKTGDGRTGFTGTAADEDGARAEALRIAGEIKAGKTGEGNDG